MAAVDGAVEAGHPPDLVFFLENRLTQLEVGLRVQIFILIVTDHDGLGAIGAAGAVLSLGAAGPQALHGSVAVDLGPGLVHDLHEALGVRHGYGPGSPDGECLEVLGAHDRSAPAVGRGPCPVHYEAAEFDEVLARRTDGRHPHVPVSQLFFDGLVGLPHGPPP